jgi:hypothetical protein
LKQLTSLLGRNGTCTIKAAEVHNIVNHYRVRWDGANWYWAKMERFAIAMARWDATVQAWRRHGQVLKNVEHMVSLPYSAATRALYFIPQLRPPAVVRRLLCSVAGELPRVAQSRLKPSIPLEAAGNTADAFREMYGKHQAMLVYSNVSRLHADEVARFLGGVVTDVV